MAEMVWCQSCKTVVWAYNHQPKVDLRGICNMLALPCPKCGHKGNYDGWGNNELTDNLITDLEKIQPVYDMWSAMRAIAVNEQVAWEPSPDNDWFSRPEL